MATLYFFDQWRETLGLPGIAGGFWVVGFYFLASPGQKERMVEQVWFFQFASGHFEAKFLVPFLGGILFTLFTIISYYRRMLKAKTERILELEQRIKKLEPFAPWVTVQPKLDMED